MAISAQALQNIESLLDSSVTLAERVTAVRQQYPGLTITRCDIRDLSDAVPCIEKPDFAVFLVDRSSHCWQLTSDLHSATGLVIAARD